METYADARLARARCSLEGLSVGDAFGKQFLVNPVFVSADIVDGLIKQRILPKSPWPFTDDTQMALSVLSILRQYGRIEQDRLAESFAVRYAYEPFRGYSNDMLRLLSQLAIGAPWGITALWLFGGVGSSSNDSAMRVAPLGAYFADDLDTVVEQARLSSEVTHAQPEASAGAIAVAVAAALAFRLRGSARPTRREFLENILPLVPDSEVRERIRHARNLDAIASVRLTVALGNGRNRSVQETVPFALWCAGECLNNFEEAMWLTVSGLGNRDTTCAIVGGIVSMFTGAEGIPSEWKEAREPLPDWPFEETEP